MDPAARWVLGAGLGFLVAAALLLLMERAQSRHWFADRPASPHSEALNLRTLSTPQLRTHLLDFAREMKAFEAGFHQQEAAVQRYGAPPGVTPEEVSEHRRQAEAASRERRESMGGEYRRRFHGHALALAKEARYRLGMISNEESVWFAAIASSMLTGPMPITEQASYLEDLAGQLP
jgi:hypothetical protein